MNLKINKLPVKTWNHLNMNETNIEIDDNFQNHLPSVETDENMVKYTIECDSTRFLESKGELEDLTKKADTFLVEIPKSTTMKGPIILKYKYNNNEKAMSRLAIHACEDSVLNIILIFESLGEIDISAIQTYVYAEKNSCINIYLAQLLNESSTTISNITGVCKEASSVTLTRIELGSGKSFSNVTINLEGDSSDFNTNVAYHAIKEQVIDMNYSSYHYGKKTKCLMQVNGTLEDGSKKMFKGTIDFKTGCTGSKGTEMENILLLGENMVNGTIPLILCAEEDVEGNHGASIGNLDDKLLFYLSTRGITKTDAQSIIAMSRIENVCSEFPNIKIQDKIRNFEVNRGAVYEAEL